VNTVAFLFVADFLARLKARAHTTDVHTAVHELCNAINTIECVFPSALEMK